MKRLVLYILTAIMLLAAGCSGDTGFETDNQAGSGRISVITSFYPMYDFACKIGGDRVSVKNLVPSGMEPHDWEPSTSDIIMLEEADVFVYNGLGMEHWVDKVLSSLKNKKLVSVMAAQGIALPEGSFGEDSDPHIWLNPQYAAAELANIRDAFAKADPQNAEYYRRNYDKYAAEFKKLDDEYIEAVSHFTRKDIVVDHAAFGPLCSAYGLNQLAVEGLSAESEPDAARMAEIVDFVRQNNVKVIFSEEAVNTKVAQAIARDTEATTDVLNPLEGLTEEQLAAGDEYISVMRKNLQSLKKALE